MIIFKSRSVGAAKTYPHSVRFHGGRGMHILLRDGRVEWLEGPDAVKIEAELRAGENPPPTLDPYEAASFKAWRAHPVTLPVR